MKCRLVIRLEASPSAKEPPGTWYEVGHVIDNPKAFILVQQGVAEPADEECEIAAGLTVDGRILRQQAYQEMIQRARRESGQDESVDDTEYFDDLEVL